MLSDRDCAPAQVYVCVYIGALIWYYGFSDPATLPSLYLSTGGWALCILRMLVRNATTGLLATFKRRGVNGCR